MSFVGLLLLFLPNELEYDFADPLFLEELGSAAANSFISVGVVAAGLVGFYRPGASYRVAPPGLRCRAASTRLAPVQSNREPTR